MSMKNRKCRADTDIRATQAERVYRDLSMGNEHLSRF